LDAADLRHIKNWTIVQTEKGEVEVEIPEQEEEVTAPLPGPETDIVREAKPDGLGLTANHNARKLDFPMARCGRAKARMQWFRTIPRLVRALVALFVLSQFAGVVSSPFTGTQASASTTAPRTHHHHEHHYSGRGTQDEHGDHSARHADYCCALHAFFTGLLPPLFAVEPDSLTGCRFDVDFTDIVISVEPARLDRPPKPLP
jgi:hypothetical protein